jgi:hypothetical protein
MPLSFTQFKKGRLNPKNLPYNSIYSTSSTQEFALGTVLDLDDGRRFRYALNGAVALGAGAMTQSVAPTAHHTNIAVGSAVAIGEKTIPIATTLSTAMVLNEYAEGWLVINDATGEGQCYQIKGNDAGTTGNVYLYNGIVVALETTSEFTLVRNKFRGVVVFPTTAASIAAGVPLVAVAASAYCWLQVRGPAPALVDAGDTVVIGNPVGLAATAGTAGGFGVVDASMATAKVWGRVMAVNAATEYAVVDLTLE